jgi:hypothetical protein
MAIFGSSSQNQGFPVNLSSQHAMYWEGVFPSNCIRLLHTHISFIVEKFKGRKQDSAMLLSLEPIGGGWGSRGYVCGPCDYINKYQYSILYSHFQKNNHSIPDTQLPCSRVTCHSDTLKKICIHRSLIEFQILYFCMIGRYMWRDG